MQDQDLVRMANQIAAFFESYPPDEAVRETANHIRSFWDPRMRSQIADYLRNGGAGLTPHAQAAVGSLQTA